MAGNNVPFEKKQTAADFDRKSKNHPIALPERGLEISPTPSAKRKRLTIDIAPNLHKRIKRAAMEADLPMVELIRDLLEERFPE